VEGPRPVLSLALKSTVLGLARGRFRQRKRPWRRLGVCYWRSLRSGPYAPLRMTFATIA